MIDVFRKWIYDSKPYHGTNACVITKSEHNGIVCAMVLRDVYNRKQDCKELRMFSICGDIITGNNKWVGHISHTKMGKNTLFFPKRIANNWPIMEKWLMKTCYPLILTQRTADYFLMKSFRITGIMAGLISSSSIPKKISATYLQSVMTKCIE